MIFNLFMGISRIAFSIIVELLIAVLFTLNRKGIILLTNLITQLGLTTVMSFIFLPYIQMLIIMETIIYILEFAIYKLEYITGFRITQLTDVEQEVNGLLTIDRKPKFDIAHFACIIKGGK
jgi:hypothetical protein